MNQTFAHLPAPSPYLIIKIKLLGQLKIDLLNLLISTKITIYTNQPPNKLYIDKCFHPKINERVIDKWN